MAADLPRRTRTRRRPPARRTAPTTKAARSYRRNPRLISAYRQVRCRRGRVAPGALLLAPRGERAHRDAARAVRTRARAARRAVRGAVAAGRRGTPAFRNRGRGRLDGARGRAEAEEGRRTGHRLAAG